MKDSQNKKINIRFILTILSTSMIDMKYTCPDR